MSYSAVPTVSTGDTWSAANHNTYIRDNFAAGVPDIFTAAGDIAYATAANAAVPLAIGSFNEVLISSSDGLPVWAATPLICARRGGSATDWNTTGSTDYTPPTSIMQCGSYEKTLTTSAGSIGSTFTFPIAFSANPLVITSIEHISGTRYDISASVKDISATECTIYAGTAVTSGTSDVVNIHWIAIGPP